MTFIEQDTVNKAAEFLLEVDLQWEETSTANPIKYDVRMVYEGKSHNFSFQCDPPFAEPSKINMIGYLLQDAVCAYEYKNLPEFAETFCFDTERKAYEAWNKCTSAKDYFQRCGFDNHRTAILYETIELHTDRVLEAMNALSI